MSSAGIENSKTISNITDYILQTFPGSYVQEHEGDMFYFATQDEKMFPFATIVTKDNEYDNVSQLDRGWLYRLNIGLPKKVFQEVVTVQPSWTGLGSYLESGIDFTALDEVFPHPTYGNSFWISIISPSNSSFETLKIYLDQAYHLQLSRHQTAS